MNFRKGIVWLAVTIVLASTGLYGKEYEILSPRKKIRLKVEVNERITFTVWHDSREIISMSPVSLSVQNIGKMGENPQVQDVKRRSVNEKLCPVVRVKSKVINDVFNEMTLVFKGSYGLDFRLYDDGLAYRFRTDFNGKITVLNEEVVFNFTGDHSVYFPAETSFFTHQERLYELQPLSKISKEKMCSIPALVNIEDGPRVVITEADLEDYPGFYLQGRESASLKGIFPAVALEEKQTRDRDVRVEKRADYIAHTRGRRTFPWRVVIIAEKDGDLIESQMVYKLARPLQLEDTSWIKPGKVAWDWWNANNIYGVDFEAGINTETYKYYIDFASRYGIEYVILDEGWYVLGDLLKVKPEMDMEEILEYAEKKKVGIILWVVWKTLEDQLHPAMDQFEKWGVKGIKVDFMQRDDQWMVNYCHRIAKEAARRHLLVDFHGAYKPAGLRRAYPNVLTREGVLGLEHNKWSENVTPEHNLTLPFIRMAAGPMDYTPGAMVNAQKQNFRAIFNHPMSMGTRCHQLAMYVVYESPLQMLADSPSHYLEEEECMQFLSRVPTVWDDTRVLDGRVADYVLIARQSGEDWYVAAMTDGSSRELHVDLSFLGAGEYTMEVFKDGINAHRYGSDYKKEMRNVTRKDGFKIQLAPGGGWVAWITPTR